jgi:RNA methyltransferase, TrmH family
MVITSAKNSLLKEIRRAQADGRATEDGLFIAEGPHLLEESLRSEWTVEQVLATASAKNRYELGRPDLAGKVIEVADQAFSSAAGTLATQGVIALVRPRTWKWSDLTGDSMLVLVLDGLQDPGNAGSIVRSAEAFGATGVLLMKGSVHIGNSKFLRASAGSIFRLPFIESVQSNDVSERLGLPREQIFALTASASRSIDSANLKSACALIIGNEGAGISPELSSGATSVRIPTRLVESLNAGAAAAVALYEACRQRSCS